MVTPVRGRAGPREHDVRAVAATARAVPVSADGSQHLARQEPGLVVEAIAALEMGALEVGCAMRRAGQQASAGGSRHGSLKVASPRKMRKPSKWFPPNLMLCQGGAC